MMHTKEHTILLVSDDAELCAATRREFEDKDEGLRVAEVRTVDAARRIVADAAPSVILLEEPSATPESEGSLGKMPRLNSVVSPCPFTLPSWSLAHQTKNRSWPRLSRPVPPISLSAPATACLSLWRSWSGACARRSIWRMSQMRLNRLPC